MVAIQIGDSSPRSLFRLGLPLETHFHRYSTITGEHEVKLSLSISPCNDHESTPSTASTQD